MHLDRPVRHLSDLPTARATLFDTSAWGIVDIAGERLSARYKAGVAKFRARTGRLQGRLGALGSGARGAPRSVAEPRPCTSAGPSTRSRRRRRTWRSAVTRRRPFCIVVQASVADDTRAPDGQHTLWAYCHVPNGSDVDMTERIEASDRAFRSRLSRSRTRKRVSTSTAEGERHNPNYLGGDITGGAGTLRQTIFRPTVRWNNYRTGTPGLYLCSASTPPGGGVHGMCGYGAAHAVLSDLKVTRPPH